MVEYLFAVKVSYPNGDETFIQSDSSRVSTRQGTELYASIDSAQKAISRFKKKFPGWSKEEQYSLLFNSP